MTEEWPVHDLEDLSWLDEETVELDKGHLPHDTGRGLSVLLETIRLRRGMVSCALLCIFELRLYSFQM